MSHKEIPNRTPQNNPPADGRPTKEANGEVRIDGMAQVFEMLKVADPDFRESLLRRMAQRDPQLVDKLRVDLARAGIY